MLAGLLMIVCLQAGLVNCFFTVLRRSERLLFLVAGVCFFFYLLIQDTYIPSVAGMAILLFVVHRQATQRRISSSLGRPTSLSAPTA